MDKLDVHVRLPKHLHESLKREADEVGITLNAMINVALSERTIYAYRAEKMEKIEQQMKAAHARTAGR
jgi:hypothetical protein